MLKRILDITGAMLAVVLASPALVAIAILIKLDSRGPVFFVQDRLGKNGSVFRMFKFRTMVQNAEQMGTGLFSFKDDNRITRVGHVLRMTSLDEVPQFFNVIMGSMSIVGPRPPVTYELGDYTDFSDQLKYRFTVKPGITGLAQVSGRNDLDWDQKVEFDNSYVDQYAKWGVLLDLAILVRTVWVVVTFSNIIEAEKEDAERTLGMAGDATTAGRPSPLSDADSQGASTKDEQAAPDRKRAA